MNQTKLAQRTAVAAYGAAVLFAIHLVTYFIPSLVLLPLWFALIGCLFTQGYVLQQSHSSVQVEQASPIDMRKDR